MPAIKEIKTETDLLNSHKLIIGSFKTLADDFGLTIENCPANVAFMEYRQLIEMKEKGIKMFGLFLEGTQIGFVAIESAGKETYYIERLSVLPEFRNKGYGTKLLDFAFNYVKKVGGEKISIALMDNNVLLKNWYSAYGFKETEKKEFDHLPFIVCFMAKDINTKDKQLANLIKDLEVELLQPDVRKSTDRLSELLDDNFLEFGVSGNRYNKQDILDYLPNCAEVKYTVHDFVVLEVSADTVLATYR